MVGCMAFRVCLITFLIILCFCRFLWLTVMLLAFGDKGSTVMQGMQLDGQRGEGCLDAWTNGCLVEWTGGWMVGLDEWVNGRVDG